MRRRAPSPVPARPVAPAALAVGAALTLLADLPGLTTRGDLVRGALLPLLAALALLAGLGRGGRLARADRGALALLALPLLAALPGLLAIERPALASWAALARALMPWLSLPALALGLWRLCAGSRELLLLWRALLAAGAAAAVWVYVEALASPAAAGPFGRPGVAGPVLGALLGPALLLPWTRRTLLRSAAAALLAAACWFTHSRTGLAAAALSALLAVVLAPAAAVSRPLRRTALALAAAGALAALLLLGGAIRPAGATTLEVRRGVWSAALALVAERPLTGHGHGSFRSEVLRVRDVDEARLSRGREPYMAHGDVLQAAAEGGWPAALLLALFGAGALGLGLAAWRRRGADPWVAGALALLCAQAGAGLAEQVLPDPAHALLAAVALATLLARHRPAAAAAAGLAVRAAAWAAALLLVAVAALKARDVAADLHLRAFRDAAAEGLTLATLERATRTHLEDGVLRWRPDHADGLYLSGVSEAEAGRLPLARAAWRRALEVEPGLTAARLDLAQSYVSEDRREDAQAVLAEARLADPTRYDVVLRQGHVALGPEPVPGGPGADFDPLEPLRRYNQAAELAPGRFESEVAYARVARRLGDLEGAGEHLRAAQRIAGDAGEILFESFHLAEVEGRADERLLASLLTLALAADVNLASAVRREARACEEAAEARLLAARGRAGTAPPERGPAARAFSAFATRTLALLATSLADGDALVREARALAEQGRHEAAVARRRALLAWNGERAPADPAARRVFYEGRSNLLIETAQSAARFDGALARTLYAEGHLLKGLQFLEEGALPEARRWLEKARDDDPGDARPCVALARALARLGERDQAEAALLEALRRDPAVAKALPSEPDLAEILIRPAVQAALR